MKATFFLFALCAAAAAESVTLTSVKDSDVYSYLDSTVPTITTLNVNSSLGMAHSNHALVQFNLAALAIPAGEIGSAKLRIYSNLPQTGFNGGEIAIHRQGAAWTETGLRWNNIQPQEEVAAVAVNQSNVWVEVDVTALVAQWVAGTRSNYGFVLRPKVENVEGSAGVNIEFISREVASYAPQLIVTRAEPPALPPVVGISSQGGQIVIEWPVSGSSGWTLQETDDLSQGWTPSAATASQENGMWRVSHVPGASTKRFFRLNKT